MEGRGERGVGSGVWADGSPVHAAEVFFTVVGPVELFVTNVALKRLLLTVNRLVASVQIAPVGGVRTVRTRVALVASAGRRNLVFALDAILQIEQELGHLLQDGVFPPQRAVGVLFVMLARQVHADAARPRRIVVAARALKHPQVGMSTQPVLGDAG